MERNLLKLQRLLTNVKLIRSQNLIIWSELLSKANYLPSEVYGMRLLLRRLSGVVLYWRSSGTRSALLNYGASSLRTVTCRNEIQQVTINWVTYQDFLSCLILKYREIWGSHNSIGEVASLVGLDAVCIGVLIAIYRKKLLSQVSG
jgi:hypothetical protein